ncbi:MAG: hypothetical protein L6R40_008652 [Gallowayella cf. fulva]|nr:MAG: hypothetical protein L6R40_008652 [Xanthomendoza cf. fulva]
MSFSASFNEVYELARIARAKVAGQMNAKDQRLRLLIAHAQLYDNLDDQIERLKERRRTRSMEDSSCKNVVSVPNFQDPFRLQQQAKPGKPSSTSKQVSGSSIACDLAAECAIDDDMDAAQPLNGLSRTDTVSIQDLECPDDEDADRTVHGKPSVLLAPITSDPHHSPYSSGSTSHIVISEIPIDDSSDSDSDDPPDPESDSDSDSDSDYDGDNTSEMLSYTQTMKATPVSFSRPKDLPPHISRAGDSEDGIDISDAAVHASSKYQDFSTLGRQDGILNNSDTANRAIAPSKMTPLLPLLCDEEVSSATYRDHRLLQALHQLLDPSQSNHEKMFPNGSAFSRVFPSLASWFRSKESSEIDAKTPEEKLTI